MLRMTNFKCQYQNSFTKKAINMKKTIGVLTTIFVLMTASVFAQTELKQHKGGHSFDISLPTYMTKTIGLNESAAIQYKSTVKDVYGFVIYDTKEELTLAEMQYGSIQEFYDYFIKDFLKDQEKRKISTPQTQKKGETSFIECDATYYDSEAKTEIYYFVGIVETKIAYYKVLSWSVAENKDKFKADFQKILYCIKD
jgi:hypothetical protein